MKLKKHFAAKLIGLSFIVLGLFTACPHPNTPQEEVPANTENTGTSGGSGTSSSGGSSGGSSSSSSGGSGGSGGTVTPNPDNPNGGNGGSQSNTPQRIENSIAVIESTEQGIKFTWKSLNSNVKRIEIQTNSNSNSDESVFIINDLSQKPYIIDEYVTANQQYEYRLITRNENNQWLDSTDWFTIKATGGKGELNFTAEATEQGIKLSNIKNQDTTFISFQKFIKGNEHYDTLNIWQTEDNTFTDKYVDNGTTYEYNLYQQNGKTAGYYNGVYYNGDPVVQWPRYKTKTIKATGGSGKFVITNKDNLSFLYDPEDISITLNTRPIFNHETSWYSVSLRYYKPNRGSRDLAYYSSSNSELTKSVEENLEPGVWLFDSLYFYFEFDNYSYSFNEYNFDADKVTQTISYQTENLFMPIATPTEQGIKLEWQKLPEGTASIRIYGMTQDYFSYDLFEINDLSEVTYVVDKYVTSGQTYTYRIGAYNSNGNNLGRSETSTAKATAGSGELELTAQADSDGIHISGSKASSSSYFRIRKQYNKSELSYNDSFDLKSNSATIAITDYWTESGTEYVYTPIETIGQTSGWNNGSYRTGDDIVEYPRYKALVIQATGGAGKLKVSNSPKLTFDANEKLFKLSKKPEVSGDPDYWRLGINYKQANDQYNNTWSLAWFNSGNNNLENFNNSSAPLGEWVFNNYRLEVETEDYWLYHDESSTDDFEDFPTNITLTNANMPRLTATTATNGIKFEWSNVPENIQYMSINLDKANGSSYTRLRINDFTKTSIINEYVEAGSEYTCYLEIQKENGTWIYSEVKTFTPSTGSGEVKLANQPAATYQNNAVTFTTDPTITNSSIATGWSCEFRYSKGQNNGNYSFYKFNSDETKPSKTISSNRENGTWTLSQYCIYFETQDFDYFNYHSDISNLTGLPQTIVISDENRFGLTATPVSTGIKLEWRNLPSDTASVEIRTDPNTYQTLFTINNLESITNVTDTYVTAGTEYEYKLIARDANGWWLEETNWIKATATGGSGEKDFTATATTSGINIAVQKPLDDRNLYFYKSIKGKSSTTLSEQYYVYYRTGNQSFTNVESIEFTDTFVTNNTEYIYTLNEGLPGPSDDDVIAFPRYKTITVRATGGSGTPALLNEPEATINYGTTPSVSFSVAPVITTINGANGKELIFTYSTSNGNNKRDLIRYSYGIGDNEDYIHCNSSSDKLTRSIYAYEIKINFPLVEYKLVNTDLSKLSKMPQTITFQ